MLIGGLLAGSAADRLGRRNCLLVSLAVNFTFGVVSAVAPSVGWLIAARVCAGLGESQDPRTSPSYRAPSSTIALPTAGAAVHDQLGYRRP